jgi:hypothetical protein
MKVIIKNAMALGLGLPVGCVGYGASRASTPSTGEGLPEEVSLCEGCLAEQPLRGELMLFVNTKLTGVDSNFTSNYPLDNEGRYVGNALYVYDPTAVCADGGRAVGWPSSATCGWATRWVRCRWTTSRCSGSRCATWRGTRSAGCGGSATTRSTTSGG